MLPIWEKPELTFDENLNDFIAAVDAQIRSIQRIYNQKPNAPMQIGTWIDGTPIWRVRYIHMISADEYDTQDTNILYFAPYLSTKANVKAVLNFTAAMSNSKNPSSDDATIEAVPDMSANIIWRASKESLLAAGIDSIVGIVEFVTPEDNIITN